MIEQGDSLLVRGFLEAFFVEQGHGFVVRASKR